MAAAFVPDGLWDVIEALLPLPRPKPQGGRPRVPDRACLGGILFVLRSGIPWEMLPKELACGSGMTCWRRMRDWQESGIWQLIHFALLDWLCDTSYERQQLEKVASRKRQLRQAARIERVAQFRTVAAQ